MKSDIRSSVRRLWRLYIEYARISLTEKLTRIVAGVVLAAVCALFALMALVFVSIGLVDCLSRTMDPMWASLIVAGIYVVLIVIAIALRRMIFINPVARFLSKIIITKRYRGDEKK